jgi:hypothetical protein
MKTEAVNADNMNALAVCETIAEGINREHAAAQAFARTALEHARLCGELLIQAKASQRHGSWRGWLAQHTTISERTAQGYMRLAREWERVIEANPQRVADFSLRQALQYVADERRQVEIAEQAQPPVTIYTSNDGTTQHVGADAVAAAYEVEGTPRPVRPASPPSVVSGLPQAAAERFRQIESEKEEILKELHAEEAMIVERTQAWLDAATAALWADAGPRLDALTALQAELLAQAAEVREVA